MGFDAWFTLGTIGLVMAALVSNRMQVDTAMLGGLVLLMVAGVMDYTQAVSGFASTAVLMIGGLFVIASGLEETGALSVFSDRLLGRPKTIRKAQLRLLPPIALCSGFLNNTPIVAMCIPVVRDWAKRQRLSESHLLMPLSFAAILGGKLTLIGTASNVVVMEEFTSWLKIKHVWLEKVGFEPLPAWLEFFGIGAIGLPTAIIGILVMILITRKVLPARKPVDVETLDVRAYQVELVVQKESPVVGQTIEAAGLRHLPDLFLSQIDREGQLIPAVSPEEIVQAGDRLAFVGALDSVLDLRRRIRGLDTPDKQSMKLDVARTTRRLVESVVSSTSPLIGLSIRESNFRSVYEAVVIAVHRQGQQIQGKIGDIVLKSGDVLLLETHHNFAKNWRNRRDFYLVSDVDHSRPIRHERSGIALSIMLALVFLLIFKPFNLSAVPSVWLCALLMVLTRCVTGTIARRSINWQVLLAIAAAIGIGKAMDTSGAASTLTQFLVSTAMGMGFELTGMLIVLFIVASIVTQLVTPFGSAVLMFPIAMGMAEHFMVNPLPFVFTLMMSVGTSFMTPVGYTTNLMVYGPGSYRFMDYMRLGLPLTIIAGIVTILLTPVIFPF